MNKCPWADRIGPGKNICLPKTLEDGEELVYCEENLGEPGEKPRTDESELGPFMVCFDLSLEDIPVAQVMRIRGRTYKVVKELMGEEALELHRMLKSNDSV